MVEVVHEGKQAGLASVLVYVCKKRGETRTNNQVSFKVVDRMEYISI